jgi:ABC-type nitrate/sulfonate/bicarbonate transport system permease component
VRRSRFVRLSIEIGTPVLIFALLIWISSDSESFYFPPVTDVLVTFKDEWLFDGIRTDLVPTVLRMLGGWSIAVVIAVVLGLLIASSPVAARAAEPITEYMRAIPAPAIIPLAILVLGTGTNQKLFVIAMGSVWVMLVSVVEGIRGIDPSLHETAQAYGIKGFRRFWEITLPAASPQIASGMRVGLSLALIMTVVSELVASQDGVGYQVLLAQRTFAIPEMWAGTLMLGLIGYALNLVFVSIEGRVLAWHIGARATAE